MQITFHSNEEVRVSLPILRAIKAEVKNLNSLVKWCSDEFFALLVEFEQCANIPYRYFISCDYDYAARQEDNFIRGYREHFVYHDTWSVEMGSFLPNPRDPLPPKGKYANEKALAILNSLVFTATFNTGNARVDQMVLHCLNRIPQRVANVLSSLAFGNFKLVIDRSNDVGLPVGVIARMSGYVLMIYQEDEQTKETIPIARLVFANYESEI